MLVLLVVDGIALALLELFFLPLRIGTVEFPVTAVVALVTMPWLVSRAAGVSRVLLVAGAPLWAWLVVFGVLGIVGPENQFLLQDWRTLLLLACGTLPAALALGNALARRR